MVIQRIISRFRTQDWTALVSELVINKQRELLQSSVLEELQGRLDKTDPGDLIITRVVVRALNTDPSIKAAIRDAQVR